MKNNVKKYAIMMCVGVVINYGLYLIAHEFHLPIWMDTVGTMYVALILEPAAGLLVGLATNFLISALIYGPSSLVYYLVSAIAALAVGILLRKDGEITMKRLPAGLGCYLICGTLMSTVITMLTMGGVSNSTWEHHFFDLAQRAGMPVFVSCLFGAFVLKVMDCIVAAVALPVLCTVTPRKMINKKTNRDGALS